MQMVKLGVFLARATMSGIEEYHFWACLQDPQTTLLDGPACLMTKRNKRSTTNLYFHETWWYLIEGLVCAILLVRRKLNVCRKN